MGKNKRAKRRRAKKRQTKRLAAELLRKYDPDDLMASARRMERRFVLHVGETNSGKTYHALQALKSAPSGVYLGPLRLLALEVFDTLNLADCPCSLLTGEESVEVPFSRHIASTIEMCDYTRHYDVAVIDEAQMVADPYRGAAWTRAILGVNADEVHICLAPEARSVLQSMMDRIGARFQFVTHHRLAELVFAGAVKGLSAVEPGDALIVFSRKDVLSIAGALERQGVAASVIYGALPPASRREEVRKFTRGETSVVVATDAIGMGVSLPIRRVIFCQTVKYDGTSRRELTVSEIKQIAGRAGRYGIYDKGYVLTTSEPGLIENALRSCPPSITTLTLPFPAEALNSPFDIPTLIAAWESLPPAKRFHRASLSDALILYKSLAPRLSQEELADKQTLFRFITCPVDTGERELVAYWRDCVLALLRAEELPDIPFGTDTLTQCEARYKALDARSQLLHRAGRDESNAAEQAALTKRINAFLKADKAELLRYCRVCHAPLPVDFPFRLCHQCFARRKEQRRETDGVASACPPAPPEDLQAL